MGPLEENSRHGAQNQLIETEGIEAGINRGATDDSRGGIGFSAAPFHFTS